MELAAPFCIYGVVLEQVEVSSQAGLKGRVGEVGWILAAGFGEKGGSSCENGAHQVEAVR